MSFTGTEMTFLRLDLDKKINKEEEQWISETLFMFLFLVFLRRPCHAVILKLIRDDQKNEC